MNLEQIQAEVGRMAELAWAAGVLDLRGDFAMIPRRGEVGGLGLFMPRITMRSNKRDYKAPDELERILGGHAAYFKGTGNRGKAWTVAGAKACLLLDEQLLPYMHLRAKRVQLHAELCRMIRDFKPASFEDRAIPVEERRLRYELFKAMSRV